MRIIRIVAVTVYLLLIALVLQEAFGQDRPISLNLLHQDEFVTRTMKIIRKTGKNYKHLAMIRAYHRTRKSFVVENIQGGIGEIPVSEIQRIEFSQHVLEQMPQAQMAASEITAILGKKHRYKVASEDFNIKSGILELTDYEEITKPAARADTSDGSIITMSDAFLPIEEGNNVPEPQCITYDSSQNCFYVDIQNVVYEKQFWGGGGSSGSMKSLQ